MLLINEIFPNPAGKDQAQEFIELWNNSPQNVSLAGWSLKNQSGKTYLMQGVIGPHEYLTLPYIKTRLTIKNTGEIISLYNAQGFKADQVSFFGVAKEGASLIRSGAQTVFTKSPTPGEQNQLTSIFLVNNNFFLQKPGSVVMGSVDNSELLFFMCAAGVLSALFAVKILKMARISNYGEQLN